VEIPAKARPTRLPMGLGTGSCAEGADKVSA
jgi:hypothetical protein